MENEANLTKDEQGIKVLVRNFNVRVKGTDFKVQVQSYATVPFFRLASEKKAWNLPNCTKFRREAHGTISGQATK